MPGMQADPSLLGVRDTLRGKYGITDERIGYDGEYVTIDGKRSIKPSKNVGGTTYADQSTITSGMQPFLQMKQSTQSPASGTASGTGTTSQPNPYQGAVFQSAEQGMKPVDRYAYYASNPEALKTEWERANKAASVYQANEDQERFNAAIDWLSKLNTIGAGKLDDPVNPVDARLNEILDMAMNSMQNNKQIDPYSTPAYQAAQAQAQRHSHQATRAAQEALGASGFARSTNLTDRAQRIQNDANEYLMLQVVPQIIQQEEVRKQQEFNNYLAMMDPLYKQQSLYDTRFQNQAKNEQEELKFAMEQEAAANEAKLAAEETQYNRLWDAAEHTGRLPNALADMYGLPRGTTTLDAEKVGIQRYTAETGRINAGTNQMNAETNRLSANTNASLRKQELGLAKEKFEYEKNQPTPVKSGGLSANQFLSSVANIYSDSENGMITEDPIEREEMFLQVVDAGYDDATTSQLLSALGFSAQEIEGYLQKYGG